MSTGCCTASLSRKGACRRRIARSPGSESVLLSHTLTRRQVSGQYGNRQRLPTSQSRVKNTFVFHFTSYSWFALGRVANHCPILHSQPVLLPTQPVSAERPCVFCLDQWALFSVGAGGQRFEIWIFMSTLVRRYPEMKEIYPHCYGELTEETEMKTFLQLPQLRRMNSIKRSLHDGIGPLLIR